MALTTTQLARALGQLVTAVLAQQGKIQVMEERMDVLGSAILPPSRVPKWNPTFPYVSIPLSLSSPSGFHSAVRATLPQRSQRTILRLPKAS